MEYNYSHALSGTEKQKSNKMIEQVINRRNMHLAYQQVVRNKGSAGVDGMQVSELKPHIRQEREAIVLSIINGYSNSNRQMAATSGCTNHHTIIRV